MNIIQTPVRITSTGGVERYVHDLSCELSILGHKVTIVCAASRQRSNPETCYSMKLLSPFCRIANTDITLTLLPTLLSRHCDLIHTHLPTPWTADISALFSKIRKKPMVLTYHNDIQGEGFFALVALIYNRILLPFVLRQASRIIITRTHHISPYLAPFSKKLVHIPPGVDINRFYIDDNPVKIADLFFLGIFDEFHRYKGFDVLLEAIALLAQEGKNIVVVAGGKGPLIETYKKRTTELAIEKNVIFPGYIMDEDLPSYYSGTSAFVLPSNDPSREGFGLVLLEAMACGRPVITTEIAGMAGEIEAYGAGIVIQQNNPSELAEAIRHIIDDENTARLMGLAGRRLVVEHYDWKMIARSVETLYAELL